MFEKQFDERVLEFVKSCNNNGVRMLLVGGSAVNFYGYQRHSADVDFWIDISEKNLLNLKKALNEINYDFPDYPEKVKMGLQNISIKISPEFEIELITRFNPGRTFNQAFEDSNRVRSEKDNELTWNVLSLDDLLASKKRSGRLKDQLDIQELQKLKNK